MLELLNRWQLLLLLLLLLLILQLIYCGIVVVLLCWRLVRIRRRLRRCHCGLVWLVHLRQMVKLVLGSCLIRLDLGRGVGLLLLLLLLLRLRGHLLLLHEVLVYRLHKGRGLEIWVSVLVCFGGVVVGLVFLRQL